MTVCSAFISTPGTAFLGDYFTAWVAQVLGLQPYGSFQRSGQAVTTPNARLPSMPCGVSNTTDSRAEVCDYVKALHPPREQRARGSLSCQTCGRPNKQSWRDFFPGDPVSPGWWIPECKRVLPTASCPENECAGSVRPQKPQTRGSAAGVSRGGEHWKSWVNRTRGLSSCRPGPAPVPARGRVCTVDPLRHLVAQG